MDLGITYQLKRPPSDGQCFFIPSAPLRNGGFKGLLWDGGAAGRSGRKPKVSTVNNRFGDWIVASETPAHIAA